MCAVPNPFSFAQKTAQAAGPEFNRNIKYFPTFYTYVSVSGVPEIKYMLE